LPAIDRAEIAVLVGPFVPDGDAVLAQIGDVRVPFQEPEELVHDRLQVQPLGGDERKAVRQIEAQLMAEDGQGSGSGPVGLRLTFIEDAREKLMVWLHGNCAGCGLAFRLLY
jgi:hypothetical protein